MAPWLQIAIIDSYSINFTDEGLPEESWTIAYVGIEHEYRAASQETGNLESKNTFKWNVREGKFA